MCSLHSHEQGPSDEDPAEFFKHFAMQVIDSGADIVVAHGPHLIRGMEVYKGRPIFYSLGNFIGQNELVARLPSDAYTRFRVDSRVKPGAACRARNESDSKGFPDDCRYWETIMPICNFKGNKLSKIDIYPVSLNLGAAIHLRGRPRLALDNEAHRILGRFKSLSSKFGTEVLMTGNVAQVIMAQTV